MKKTILALGLIGLVATQTQSAKAGCGPGIAAAVVGGVVAGTIIADSVARPPAYYYAPAPAPVCPAPAVVYQQPAPVVVYPQAAYVYAPAPVVTFSFGPRYHGWYGRRGRW